MQHGMMPNGAPVMVINQNTQRETGRAAQQGNIAAAKAIADIIRTTLGPRSMLKMILDPMGGITLTNDGHAILREIDVSHPAAKSMLELSRAQDEEVGDGTTSVIILAGELLTLAYPFLERKIHPTVVVRGYTRALNAALKICEEQAVKIDPRDPKELSKLIESSIGTKFSARWSEMMVQLALQAVLTVTVTTPTGQVEVDTKRFARVEKIPGGEMSDCRVMKGVMFNKDVTHPKMRRKIVKPRILLLDCPLEYKKGETKINMEMTKEEDFNTILKLEEEYVENICAHIVALKPDIVVTEKGVSDLAQHYFVKANITAFRRLRKSDNNRIARATGATIVSRPEEAVESDIGTGCGLFEVRKIGDDYFTFLDECESPKACTIILRGGSKDVLGEVERNLQDAMLVARNMVLDPRILPGGGAIEMALSSALQEQGQLVEGVEQWPFKAVGEALQVIPRTICGNCGADTIRIMTQLRAKHANGQNGTWGVDGTNGVLADMKELGVWEPFLVKTQTLKTAIEASCMLLRIDDIVSGISGKKKH